ncbi:MAG: hypothetical protein JRJ58_02385 [Deltaproteobacteria bacterium]|nr:hypothetical protein [Deltaproteobacteria bacterium]
MPRTLVLEDLDLEAEPRQSLAVTLLIDAGHQQHPVGSQDQHRLESRIEEATDPGQRRDLSQQLGGIVIDADQSLAGTQPQDDRSQRRVE